MRQRGFSAAALAALSLSFVFAATAHADALPGKEKGEFCVETQADADFMAAHPPDRESQRAAWNEIEADLCLWVEVDVGQFDELAYELQPCITREHKARQQERGAGRAIIEGCLAALPSHRSDLALRAKHAKKKRHAKRAHQDKRARIALAGS
jgi:hypothetical protein